MKKATLNTKGFGLVGMLVVLLVIAVVGFSGWMVWQKNHDNKKTTTTNSSSESTKESEEKSSSYTAQEAVDTVQSAYSAALSYVQKTTNADQGEIDTIKNYLDTPLYNKLTAANSAGASHDLILCAQTTPDKITASLKSSTADTATINVAEVFGTEASNVIVDVNLTSLKITNITC